MISLVGGNCGGSASFFLYSEHACFPFYIRHPWVRPYRCCWISLLEVGSRDSHLWKRGILTINIQTWKDKFWPIFCLWASVISSSGSKDNNWMTLLWCTRTSPSPCWSSSPQDVYYQTFEIHSKSQEIKNSFKIWTRTWGWGCTRGRYFFSQMPP